MNKNYWLKIMGDWNKLFCNKKHSHYVTVCLQGLVIGLIAVFSGCKGNSYSSELKAEKKLIKEYIARENINVIYQLPADSVAWGEKDYYQVPGHDYLYFHLDKHGARNTDSVISTEKVIMRYKKYTLTVNPDTADYWTTLNSPYPVEFSYLTDNRTPMAWHTAVGLMKYSDAECRIICPSKLGFSEDQTSVTPYGYQLKMKIKR